MRRGKRLGRYRRSMKVVVPNNDRVNSSLVGDLHNQYINTLVHMNKNVRFGGPRRGL